jgi:hypothetical protein
LIWKLKGTKFNRLLLVLVPKTHRTEGIEFGLLPTPMAQNRNTTEEQTLKRKEKYGGMKRAMYLENYAALGLLPTPTSGSKNSQHSMAEWGGSKNKTREIPGSFSPLNTQFVAEMMGYPPNWTALPFQSGEKNQSKHTATP